MLQLQLNWLYYINIYIYKYIYIKHLTIKELHSFYEFLLFHKLK
jgi:hypothetical protein